MSTQEIYFRTVVVLLGISISVGAVVIEAAIVLKLLEALAGIFIIIISTIRRFKLWP